MLNTYFRAPWPRSPPPLSAYGPALGVTTVGYSGLIPALALSTSRRFSHCKQASSPLTLLLWRFLMYRGRVRTRHGIGNRPSPSYLHPLQITSVSNPPLYIDTTFKLIIQFSKLISILDILILILIKLSRLPDLMFTFRVQEIAVKEWRRTQKLKTIKTLRNCIELPTKRVS